MQLTSLRNKIFLFVVLILMVGAGLVMFVAQKDVIHTVTTMEDRTTDNVLNLLVQDSKSRWDNLINEKANLARQAREPIIQHTFFVISVLKSLNKQINDGFLTEHQARAKAMQWVRSLNIDSYRQTLLLDGRLNVLASNNPHYENTALTYKTDLKGRTLIEIVNRELPVDKPSFIIYRNTTDHSSELRYATILKFAPWNWLITISDSAQPIINQYDRQRSAMQSALSDTVKSIDLTGPGFVFIVNENGKPITPIPKPHTNLLTATLPDHNNMAFSEALEPVNNSSLPSLFFADIYSVDENGQPPDQWLIKTAQIKALKWTVIAAIPSTDIAKPAIHLRNRIGLLFLIGLIAALFIAWALSARITKPLMQLSAFARMLPEHDLTTTQGLPEQITRIQSRHKDEVGDLASAFIYMDEQLRKNILNLLNETARQERFQSELNIARNIQLGLLPTKPSNKILEKVDLHAHMLPAKDVGGDLYDYFMLTDHSLCFAIGDVSDKGIPAALFMAITRTLIRTCAEDSTNPSILMERINNRLVANNPNMMFVTLIIGVLNLDTGELIWANAGHPPLCVIQPNHKLQLLEGRSGPACGVQANIPYKSFSTVIQSNEAIFGYTDGISEAMNVDQQFYGEQHLYYQLRMANLNTTSATEYSDLVISSVRQFAGDYDQSDDITTLVIKR